MSQTTTTIRLDVWLDVACLYRTRSEAQRACQGGKVEVNGQSSKPHRQVKIGDQLRLSRPYGRKQTLTVAGLADKHVPRAEARLLYQDTTPPISEEEKELRRLERIYRAGIQRTHAPDKRERRAIRKLKGR
ncbi:MAG TPA: RNA-binding S4 domain-containing protein [Vicinamibacterales bacterium]|nr:RNA-binding S4 domain-containing protein [Vicinamibacterales bacterium]